ncbi:DUF559 domain-containing protein [Falsochrobactrum sp. TDYN1]|uniref:DUF559 domain-containing protein n=1 Tax=Falsochrobactrum tianjinense TaxID=2706015 RepID=A0A949PN73_9HYPH|nr:DUF559 domain-containing protein [Falsochrobactrum sp. TDYN1]MBV2144218.1 DUF559 domain-containing protein [Falsochrobactrum sp. TDYN1]
MKKSKLYGFDLLRQQTISSVLEVLDDRDAWVMGDTEIEKLLCAAISARIMYGRTEFSDVLNADEESHAQEYFSNPHYRTYLILQPQVQIGNYRVDFVLSAWTSGYVYSAHKRSTTEPYWRKLVIECDGHEYHERTKEQASKDRSRDRDLTNLGFDVFRFTGSELWRDPWECADQLYYWALRGW